MSQAENLSPGRERIRAVMDLNLDPYAMKHADA